MKYQKRSNPMESRNNPKPSRLRRQAHPTRPVFEAIESRILASSVPAFDTTFSQDGVVLGNEVGGVYATFTDAEVTADGKIIAVGQGTRPGHADMDLFAARYNSDGSPDNTFDSAAGKHYRFFDPFNNGSTEWAGGIVMLPDGGFIIAGSSGSSILDVATKGYLFKFTASGNLDTTWGSGGAFTDATQNISGVAVQGTKLLVGGTDGDKVGVLRLTSSGQIDNTFGQSGRILFDFSNLTSKPIYKNGSISMRADGSFVVSGSVGSEIQKNRDVTLANFGPNGNLEPGFGSSSGLRTLDALGDEAGSARVQPNGSLLITEAVFDSGYYLRSSILSPEGSLGQYFYHGFADTPSSGNYFGYIDLIQQNNGQFIGLGTSSMRDAGAQGGRNTAGIDTFITRATADRSAPDSTWGNSGIVTPDSFGFFPTGATLTPDGKLLAFGWWEGTTDYPLALARFNISENNGNIQGTIFDDLDGDGIQDFNEPSHANVPVYIDANNNSILDVGESVTTTNVFGGYSLTNLPAGTYIVRADLTDLADWHFSLPSNGMYSVTLSANATVVSRNFGIVPPPAEIAVSFNGTNIVDGETFPSSGEGTAFGSTPQNAATISRTYRVSNAGGVTLTTSGLTIPTGFTVTEGLSSSIAPGEFDEFTIRLDSDVIGTKAGQITFANSDGNENPYNFTITGMVNPPSVPEVGVEGNSLTIVDGDTTPSPLDHTEFGTVTLGGVVVSRTFTVLNTGTAALTTSDLTVPAGFTITEGLLASIPAGGSDTFTVQLDSTTTGTRSDQITFNTNDPAAGGFVFAVAGRVMPPPVTISEADKTFVVPYTNIKVSLKGAGTATIRPGLDGSIDGIELTGSNSKSSLTITPVNKGETGRVGDIVVGDPSNPNDRTSLGSLVGKLIQLTAGLTITGGTKTLTLASATNGADIVIGSAFDIVSSTMTFGSLSGVTINTATPIKTFKVNSWLDSGAVAALTTPWIGTMSVQGGMEADVSVTESGPGSSLKKLTVVGALTNVTMRSVGNMGAVTVGSITGSRVLAGIHSAVTGAPVSSADFVWNAVIASFTSKGGFSNSVLAASNVPKVTLGSVSTIATGNKFGIYTREAPKSFKRGDVAKGYKLTPVATRPADIEPFVGDDFEVKVF